MLRVADDTPVIVAAGQTVYRDGEAPEPVDLVVEAVRNATESASLKRLSRDIRSVRIVRIESRRYPDPAELVAERLGLRPDIERVVTGIGGHMPQVLVNRTFEDIRAGRVDAVVIGGAESMRTRRHYKRTGRDPGWSTQADGCRPTRVIGSDFIPVAEHERAIGLGSPIHMYPLFETAFRHRRRRSVADQRHAVSSLWARFARVAADNPYAALTSAPDAASIATPGPENRPISHPYSKLHVANDHVDQAAALIMCSAGAARRYGIPAADWVFVHGYGECDDTDFVSHRDTLHSSPALGNAARGALAAAGVERADEIDHVDLYSCFPCAVEIAADELELCIESDLTVTGGLTFAGGPWHNYVTHSIATMVGRLREHVGTRGLCTANGGMLTKHAAGVYAAEPRARTGDADRLEAANVRRRSAIERHEGRAVVEGYTVAFDRAGSPQRTIVAAITEAEQRVLLASDDPGVAHEALATSLCGRAVVASGRTFAGPIHDAEDVDE